MLSLPGLGRMLAYLGLVHVLFLPSQNNPAAPNRQRLAHLASFLILHPSISSSHNEAPYVHFLCANAIILALGSARILQSLSTPLIPTENYVQKIT
jgi:hypothetical protein